MTHRKSPRPAGPAPRRPRRAGWAVVVVVGLMPGCFGAPTPVEPQVGVDAPETFSRSGAAVATDDWWTHFEDPALAQHVEQALAANRALDGL